jgi:Uma2 family endonuclease
MAIMSTEHTAHQASWPISQQADLDTEGAALEDLFWSLGEIPGHRVEMLQGRIVMNAAPVRWHGRVSSWLARQFDPACLANGWEQYSDGDLLLPLHREISRPDQIIVSDPHSFTDLESAIPARYVLLVSEIVSASSAADDRQGKRLSYAQAGIPFYLLVDRFAEPWTLTLFSEPAERDYSTSTAVTAGPAGGVLRIPAPFAFALDASTMPAPILQGLRASTV